MAFINLPPIPATVSDDLRDKLEAYRVGYFASEEQSYQAAFAMTDEIAAFDPSDVADLAAKLIVAFHQLAPGDQHETLFQIDPSDITDDRAGRLLIACVNDAIRLAAIAEWERNLAAYRRAHETFLRTIDLFSIAENHADYDGPIWAAIEAHNSWAMNAEVAAEKRLLATAAPDLTAALIKAEILEDTHCHHEGMKALRDDLARLETLAAAA